MHLSREAVGRRLQEERRRIGLNQDDFAQKVNIAKRTLAGYEAGTSDVGAAVMAKASELGVDVLYVVTGERRPSSAEGISADEIALVMAYRSMSDAERSVLRRISGSITGSESSQKLSDTL